MRLQEVIPNLWLLDVSTAHVQTRAALVVGEERAVVWDSLTRPEDAAPLVELIGEKPYFLVYSHADWDHIWGSAGLPDGGLGVIGHADCLRRFGDDVPRTLQRMQLAELGEWLSVRLVPPNITFTRRLSLDLGGVTLDLHHAPGHTADSIVGWIPEWGILLGGDAIETPLPVVNNAQLLAGWQAALESWQQVDRLARAIPSHGSLAGRESLDGTVAYLRALAGDRQFNLPAKLDDFYRETHQKNLIVVDGGLALHE
ncbi:MAG: MBL fold metallo-hydrolase [Chloroflexota bacterium]|nr:MBL fold metallo-hydrolase [Chloroflexota bacterium]